MNLKATSPLSEWLSYLENSHFKAIDLGLERIKSVAEKMDLLHTAPYVITVGGTNGKGTTCRLLETILLRHGLRVGVYSSPHLLRYNERVRIQNQDLPNEAHTTSFAFIEENKTESLTYFEFSTLSALHLFKQHQLDVVILEVGLGGRLDATNIVDSNLAVITSIDIDHTDFLGNTREAIAFEKAGIFRQNCPVVIGEANVPNTMLEQAARLDCQVSRRELDWSFQINSESWQWQSQKVRLENLPFCQIPLMNAATALAVVEQLPFDIQENTLREALQSVELVGRFQTIKEKQREKLANLFDQEIDNLPTVIVDVGHNPHAAAYLSEKLTALKAQKQGKLIAVCGMLKDKDAQGVFTHLVPIVDEWHCATLGGYRGQTGGELQLKLTEFFPDVKAKSQNSVMNAVQIALKSAVKNDIILIFGSFHTVAEFWQEVE
ncbi:bifunctional tetrahydrofolate synthase/dihydrofolate synthase [Rodentibacter genomosp. 2]|uniref:Dihydrofolate synthase/folylpolyglutamate synthase n=1 Tax=Rodentibacter genomosp. 2 TaxID=1908266 RepID=A0A1V3JCA7_9PAST|nr:bifunctional tetrahydrofolate synthase/dihydrofolate synthase [Rodentibacter genomosp. 2]OOF54239.1 bifunctional folylpolyglutamate synthase/dihydrofolate synthase [Rodentibacter genomosp. 2]